MDVPATSPTNHATAFPPTFATALASRPEDREDWSRALRFYNPTTFDDCGCIAGGAQQAYIPTEREVRDLRYFGPPDQTGAEPPVPEAEPEPEPAMCPVSLDELAAAAPPEELTPQPATPASTDWASYTPEQRDAAMLAFAVRGGLVVHSPQGPFLVTQCRIGLYQ